MSNESAFLTKEQIENPLLRRALLYLEDKEWRNADEACERVLDEEPENAYAYVIKLMVELRVRDEQELRGCEEPIDNDRLFQKALKFAQPELREQLMALANGILELQEQRRREEEQRQQELERIDRENCYHRALFLMKPDVATASIDSLEKARALLRESKGYQDAAELIAVCDRCLRERRAAEEARTRAQKKKRTILISAATVLALAIIILVFSSISSKNAKRAEVIGDKLWGKQFTAEYHDIDVKPGSMIASRYEEIRETIHFTSDHTVTIKKVSSIDYDGTVITTNGVKQFDTVNTSENTYTYSKVSVSIGGEATIVINGRTYEVLVNSNDVPIGLKHGSTSYH